MVYFSMRVSYKESGYRTAYGFRVFGAIRNPIIIGFLNLGVSA